VFDENGHFRGGGDDEPAAWAAALDWDGLFQQNRLLDHYEKRKRQVEAMGWHCVELVERGGTPDADS
jgi:hypothetical protein